LKINNNTKGLISIIYLISVFEIKFLKFEINFYKAKQKKFLNIN